MGTLACYFCRGKGCAWQIDNLGGGTIGNCPCCNGKGISPHESGNVLIEQERLEIRRGDAIRVLGSRFDAHNTLGTVISAYRDPLTGEYGIEYQTANGYEYWKQWTDGGIVLLLCKADILQTM